MAGNVQDDPEFQKLPPEEQQAVLRAVGGAAPAAAPAPAPAADLPVQAEPPPTFGQTFWKNMGPSAVRMTSPFLGARFGTPGVAGTSMLGEWLARRMEGKPDNPMAMIPPAAMAVAPALAGTMFPAGYNAAAQIATPKTTWAAADVADKSVVPGTIATAQRLLDKVRGGSASIGQLESARAELPKASGELKPGFSRLYKAIKDEVRAAAEGGDKNAAAYSSYIDSMHARYLMREAVEDSTKLSTLGAGAAGAYTTQQAFHSPLGALAAVIPGGLKLLQAIRTAPPTPWSTSALQALYQAAIAEGMNPKEGSPKK